MNLLKSLNLLLAFLLEITMVISLGYVGFSAGDNVLKKYLFAAGLPTIAIVLWGIWAAPKSQYRLEFTSRILFGLTLFLLSAFLLYKTGQTNLAVIFAVFAIFSETIAYIFKQ